MDLENLPGYHIQRLDSKNTYVRNYKDDKLSCITLSYQHMFKANEFFYAAFILFLVGEQNIKKFQNIKNRTGAFLKYSFCFRHYLSADSTFCFDFEFEYRCFSTISFRSNLDMYSLTCVFLFLSTFP